MNREAFTINRQLEFFDESELSKQLGHSPEYWPAVLVAELVDNALDHCEEAGVFPDVSVTVSEQSITVADNGQGLPPHVVSQMVDFETRTSSRLGYASPTRGAQGNAGKCLFALPYVLNGTRGLVEIDACGVCHHITTSMDRIARMPLVDHVQSEGKVQFGTSIRVELPCFAGREGVDRIVSLLQEYAAFNNHAAFRLDFFGQEHRWDRSASSIDKWTAKNPDPVHWHDISSFENLIASTIHSDRGREKSRTVREFVRQFAGLKRSAALKTVLDAVGMTRCELAELVGHDGVSRPKAIDLLEAMKAASEPPKPLKLGSIGRDHIESALGGQVAYRRVAGFTKAGLPFVVEAAFSERDDGYTRQLFTGVNFSVDVRSPAIEAVVESLEKFLVDRVSSTSVLLHLTTPRISYTNRGKTDVDTCPTVTKAVEDCLQSVTKVFTAKMKSQERDASRRSKKSKHDLSQTQVNLREAIFSVMDESIDSVSQGGTCDFSARNHFYAVRPLIQKYCPAEITQGYLDRVIDEWEAIYGIIERRTRDPRGFLLEPHTGKQIPLGTRQVDGYEIPLHLYHTIIYVEKKGLLSNFQFGKVAEKYDAAIICAEGYAVRAAQALMQAAACGHAMKVFIFHDADPAGYGIARAIGANSGAHKFDFEVIDAGLHLDEALEMGLPTEMFTRSKSLASNVAFSESERKLFTGHRQQVTGKNGKSKSQWTGCQRVELNALAAHPQRFVEWVEAKLVQHGAAKKLIPIPKVFAQKITDDYQQMREQSIRSAVEDALNIPEIVKRIDRSLHQPTLAPDAYRELVEWGQRLESHSWSAFSEAVARSKVAELEDQITRAAQEVRHG